MNAKGVGKFQPGAAPQGKGTKLIGNAVSVRELSFGKIRDATLHYSPTLSALAKQTLALFLGRCPRLEFANTFGVHWLGSSSILLPLKPGVNERALCVYHAQLPTPSCR